MNINRRQFLILSASATCGCAAGGGPSAGIKSAELKAAAIDAGPIGQFATDGIYDQFAGQGFFILRQGPQLLVISSLCTHRQYPLQLQTDQSLYCKAHGSCFDRTGKVTEGPATRDLPILPTRVDEHQHLIVLAIA